MFKFISQEVRFNLAGKNPLKSWLKSVAEGYGCSIGEINIIFCNDEYLLSINRKYLNHNFLTDIITFDYRVGDVVSGDIYISVETVLSNSESYSQIFSPPFECELCRVMVHGILHLVGEDDQTPSQKKKMRVAERGALEGLKEAFKKKMIRAEYKQFKKG